MTEAASDALRTTSDAARKVVTTGKMAASAGAKKAGQAGKRVAKTGRRLTVAAADSLERGATFVKDRLDPKHPEQPKLIAVEQLSEESKLAYMQTLVWLTFQDDKQIDLREVSKLQLLMVQVRCDADTRQAVRNAIEDPTGLDPDKLVQRTLESARAEAHRADIGNQQSTNDEGMDIPPVEGEAQQEAVGFSLLKDAIWLRLETAAQGTWPAQALTLATSARDDPGIHRLAELVGADTRQLAVLEEACIAGKKLLDEQHDDKLTRQIAKDLASRAASVGVPVAAVYLSGSVTGLSAAGVTSGLAALGLGGVLGLSAMVTGIGNVVVGGVAVYRGSRWIMNPGAHARAQRREAKLQEILRNHQRAIANLAEDIGHLGVRLVGLTEDVEVNRARIKKLASGMTLFGNALGQLREREASLEDELRHAQGKREAEEGTEEDVSSDPPDQPESTGST